MLFNSLSISLSNITIKSKITKTLIWGVCLHSNAMDCHFMHAFISTKTIRTQCLIYIAYEQHI